MLGYISKRLGLAVLVAMTVSIIAYMLLYLSGDPALAIAGEGARINGRRLGRWLSKQESRVVDGCKFSSQGTRGGQSIWALEQLDARPSGVPRGGVIRWF